MRRIAVKLLALILVFNAIMQLPVITLKCIAEERNQLENIYIDSLEVLENLITIEEGEKIKLDVTIMPENADNKTLEYASDDETIVTVTSVGVITAKGEGETIVRIRTTDGSNIETECYVVVKKVPIQQIYFQKNKITIDNKQKIKLNPQILPLNATYKTLAWESSDNKIAQIDNDGNVIGISKGQVIITAIAADGTGVTGSCIIEVKKYSINKSSTTIRTGNTTQLKLANAGSKITWETSKKSIATVTKDGLVKAVKKGTCTITATIGKEKYTCKVTVRNPYNPDFIIAHSGQIKETKSNVLQIAINNCGRTTFVLESGALYIDESDYVAVVSKLKLVSNETLKNLTKKEIKTKAIEIVTFKTVNNKKITINNKTKIKFNFTYDGVKYIGTVDGLGKATYMKR